MAAYKTGAFVRSKSFLLMIVDSEHETNRKYVLYCVIYLGGGAGEDHYILGGWGN